MMKLNNDKQRYNKIRGSIINLNNMKPNFPTIKEHQITWYLLNNVINKVLEASIPIIELNKNNNLNNENEIILKTDDQNL